MACRNTRQQLLVVPSSAIGVLHISLHSLTLLVDVLDLLLLTLELQLQLRVCCRQNQQVLFYCATVERTVSKMLSMLPLLPPATT